MNGYILWKHKPSVTMKAFVTLFLVFTAQLVWAQTPIKPPSMAITAPLPRADAEKEVIETEKQRFIALVSDDFAVLDHVLADDLVYTHSSGKSDTKQSYMQSLREGKTKYKAMDTQEQKVRLYGNTAVINGKCLMNVTSNGAVINTLLAYTSVYVRTGNQWQLVAWQSLRVPN